MGSIQKLTGLIAQLESGGDPTRLFAVRAAYNFKHSWLEMAQALVEVRSANRFAQWGYDSFFDYCEREIGLKRAVVDKLTVSFQVLQQTAPHKIDAPAEDETIPTYQALDYYARATGELRVDGCPPTDAPVKDLSPELNQQLYDAVFEQGCTTKQLKDRFDPILRPKTPTKEQKEQAQKTFNTVKKLMEQLDELDGISPDTRNLAIRAMSELHNETQKLINSLDILVKHEEEVASGSN